jgi:hypothetical protein
MCYPRRALSKRALGARFWPFPLARAHPSAPAFEPARVLPSLISLL